MFYLIYVSSAVEQMTNEELLFLLYKSRENNKRLGITGMLLYKSGNFMQMLEGDKQAVLDLYGAIQRDPLHRNVLKVLSGDILERNFEDWSMGFSNMDEAGDYPPCEEYLEKNLGLRTFHEDSDNAFQFMTRFSRRMA